MHFKINLFLWIICLLYSPTVMAQATHSAMSGHITGQNEDLTGATVIAIHRPSGTQYAVVTNNKGYFHIEGMRTGGPYTVEISYVGYQKAVYQDIHLNLSETYILNTQLQTATALQEVIIRASGHKNEKTGPVTHIREKQWLKFPNISRSLKDLLALSPYAQGSRLGGRDQRQNNFTVDGANFNYNMGLDGEVLPAGGTPISIDALEAIQISIAPFDVRQSHFVGGSVNAITKSGTNRFQGSAYTYWQTENLRGNKIAGEDLGERPKDRKQIYGFTLGGPILKNRLFFFINGEYEHKPMPIYKWQPSPDGTADAPNFISRTTAQDMDAFRKVLIERYHYDPGSYTDFNGENNTYRLMARIDWNISNRHKFMLRYNYSSQKKDNPVVNAAQGIKGAPMSQYSMTFNGSCWTNTNSINSWTGELNSRLGPQSTNQLLVSYTVNDANKRKGNSREFPTIDILEKDDSGDLYAYMNAGYDQHAWRNGIDEKSWSITDNLTYNYVDHYLMAGFSYESTVASNCYMRYAPGYYRYDSFEDFVNGAPPSAFAICYSLTGEKQALSKIHYDELSIYLQDQWKVTNNMQLTFGLRMDLPFYLNHRYANKAIESYDFNGTSISTAHWPKSQPLFAPRIGFSYNILENGNLKIRGGTGIFNGRFPLIFLSKMQEASGILQHTYLPNTSSKDPEVLNALQGGIREREEVIALLKEKFPEKFPDTKEASVTNIVTIDRNFKMPQVWKNSLALDYHLPIALPVDLTLEATYTKDLNAILYKNINLFPLKESDRFNGPDRRYYYPANKYIHPNVNDAILMTNTHKGYSYTLNATLTAEPVPELNLSAAYTYTRSRVISNNTSNQVDRAWSLEPSVNGPNYQTLHASSYMHSPHRVIGQISYQFEWFHHLGTLVSLFYEGMHRGCYSFVYQNDINNDGLMSDLIYIPRSQEELHFEDYTIDENGRNKQTFTAQEQQKAFWNFIHQDPYLRKRKGKYAEAYGAYLPWVNRFNLRFVQDIHISPASGSQKLQVSLDILNIGNLFNSAWGVDQSAWNAGKLLSYKRKNEQNEPVYIFNTIVEDGIAKLPTKSFYPTRLSAQCWSLQIGIKYIFN